jgi:DNA topoisomerase-1
VQDKDVEMKDADAAHSAGKRKSRISIDNKKSYVEPESSEEEDEPLVRHNLLR